ncbi:TetR/AcrR family transcriptional regulator [Umezawaea sp.]|uniref:TetR/AcrR family transcriptional regulator n=1 Tax=Umezawaea sp. TaxID=1955258 RepID=UPI002ED193E4
MPETRTRRRGTALEQAILDAAWAELRDVGYARFTIDSVAARARTSKPVIYRRWSNRAELVFAAWGNQAPAEHLPPDTGALRTDLLVLFTRIARRADAMMNEMIVGVMSEAFRHPEVADLLRDRLLSAPVADVVRTIVDRAAERGEIPPTTLSPRAGRLPFDLVRNDAVLSGGPMTNDAIVELVDDVYLPLLRGLALTRDDEGHGLPPAG